MCNEISHCVGTYSETNEIDNGLTSRRAEGKWLRVVLLALCPIGSNELSENVNKLQYLKKKTDTKLQNML